MAKPTVAEIIWIFNRANGNVQIVEDGKVLETCKLSEAPRRLAFCWPPNSTSHRNHAVQRSGMTFVEARATKRVRA